MFYLNNTIIIQITDYGLKTADFSPKHDLLLKISNDATPITVSRYATVHS